MYTLITTITHPYRVKLEWNWTAMYPEMIHVRQLIMTVKVYSFSSHSLEADRWRLHAKPKRMQILQISEIIIWQFKKLSSLWIFLSKDARIQNWNWIDKHVAGMAYIMNCWVPTPRMAPSRDEYRGQLHASLWIWCGRITPVASVTSPKEFLQ